MNAVTPRAVAARPAVWLVLLAAAGTFALTMGARQSMGLFLSSINTSTGLGLARISLAFAFGQLWWGLTQPFAGFAADRYGPGRVLVAGVWLVAVGTALIPFMHSLPGLVFAIGVLAAGGAGLAGPSVLMAATARLVPASRRGMATGVVNAGGSMGQFVFAPLAQAITAAAGWVTALHAIAALTLLALPAAWVLRRQRMPALESAAGAAPASSSNSSPATASTLAVETTGQILRRAVADRSYQLLAGGFFVCGFHVAFLVTHLPGVVASCQLPPVVGGWALSMVGLFNVVGSFGMGWAVGFRGGIWRMKSLLSLVYASRALAILCFVFAPKSTAVVLVFAAFMGLTFLSTVPPTVGLVAKFFGPAQLGTLFGVVMVSHQLGGFLGALLGGKAFELTGSYTWMWYADALLAAAAALMHLPIREPRASQNGKPAPGRTTANAALN